ACLAPSTLELRARGRTVGARLVASGPRSVGLGSRLGTSGLAGIGALGRPRRPLVERLEVVLDARRSALVLDHAVALDRDRGGGRPRGHTCSPPPRGAPCSGAS